MDTLRRYLNSLPPLDQIAFAQRAGTTIGYLRKALSRGQSLGEGLCIALERESGRHIRCEQLRPDVDWAFIRGTELVGASRAALLAGECPHA